jgi:hypothetical protein
MKRQQTGNDGVDDNNNNNNNNNNFRIWSPPSKNDPDYSGSSPAFPDKPERRPQGQLVQVQHWILQRRGFHHYSGKLTN